MTDPTQIGTNVPITITLDLDQLLASTVGPIPAYTGDPDGDWEPDPVGGAIIHQAATILARSVNHDERVGYRTRYREAIQEALGRLVEAELDKPFLPVDAYGEPRRGAEPTTLRAEIGRQAADLLAMGMAPNDRYSNDPVRGALKKYIDGEIDRQIKGELQEAVKQAKLQVIDKVKANVAAVITDTITRTAVR
jgi:hypothetical protein